MNNRINVLLEKHWPPARKPAQRKFKRGPAFQNIGLACQWILAGGWVYWSYGGRPKHPRVMDKMSLETIACAVRDGLLFQALRNPEETP